MNLNALGEGRLCKAELSLRSVDDTGPVHDAVDDLHAFPEIHRPARDVVDVPLRSDTPQIDVEDPSHPVLPYVVYHCFPQSPIVIFPRVLQVTGKERICGVRAIADL